MYPCYSKFININKASQYVCACVWMCVCACISSYFISSFFSQIKWNKFTQIGHPQWSVQQSDSGWIVNRSMLKLPRQTVIFCFGFSLKCLENLKRGCKNCTDGHVNIHRRHKQNRLVILVMTWRLTVWPKYYTSTCWVCFSVLKCDSSSCLFVFFFALFLFGLLTWFVYSSGQKLCHLHVHLQ